MKRRSDTVTVEHPSRLRRAGGIQLPLIVPPPIPRPNGALERKGIVYTKQWVVELLLNLAGYTPENNLVDAVAVEPSAGSGAFLDLMIKRLLGSCQKLGRPFWDCRNSLLAYELDNASAERARTTAVRVLLSQGATLELAERLAGFWVRTGDYLFESADVEADFVIGNPPYLRHEDIPENTATLYRKAYTTMRGRADLYIAFFEAALRQLRVNGVCAFICADRWMRNQYGADLRELITSGYNVELVIEMHNADAFQDDVDAYPAITIIRYNRQSSAVVASAGPEAEKMDPLTLSAMLQVVAKGDLPNRSQAVRRARIGHWFKGKEAWPCHSPEQLILLRRLEEQFSPLELNAKVGIGVATGNDGIFITRNARLVEGSRLLKLALVRDISEGRLDWSGHYLVNPWNTEGLVTLDDYPQLQAYFEQHAIALKKRHTAIKNVHGWYRTIDRVTHTLTTKLKLYIPDINNKLEPVMDWGETYPHHNLYFVQSDQWDLEILGGILMSTVGQFFVECYGVRMRGGYLRFQSQYLRRIRVPDPHAISKSHARELMEAFRQRDKQRANRVALELYEIQEDEMEAALGYR